MPIEFTMLQDKPEALTECPNCGAEPFESFLRGQVQRAKRTLFSWPPFKLRPYCSVVCYSCKEVVGHELPTV